MVPSESYAGPWLATDDPTLHTAIAKPFLRRKHRHVYQRQRTLPFAVATCVSATCQIYKHTLSHLIATFAVGMYLRVMCHRTDACVFYFCERSRRLLMFSEIWKGCELFPATLGDEALCSRGAAAPGGEQQVSLLFFFFSILNKWPPRRPFSFCFCSHTLGEKKKRKCLHLRARIHKCHDTQRLRSIYLQDACC